MIRYLKRIWLAIIGKSEISEGLQLVKQANKAIEELQKENARLKGENSDIRTIVIKPPSHDEFKKYCVALNEDIMFRYLLLQIIDVYFIDMINNHNKDLHDMYRGRLLGVKEIQKKINEWAIQETTQTELSSFLHALGGN